MTEFLQIICLFLGTLFQNTNRLFFLVDTPKKVDEIHRAMFLRIHVYL